MKGVIVFIVALVVVGYTSVQVASMYKARSDLSGRVEYYLDFVDESAMDSVKQNLVHDAGKYGVELAAENIHIVYEDTERLTVPQKLVEGRVAQFSNKHVAISVEYADRIFGWPFKQTITRSKIKTVQMRPVAPTATELQLLDIDN